MDNLFLFPNFSGEVVSLITFICEVGIMLFMVKFWGKAGLCVYMVLACVLGNVQVMKLGLFDSYAHPVALGTITFCTSFLATDILNEYYGARAAKNGVYVSFFSIFAGFFMMYLTLMHPFPEGDEGHNAMRLLFLPLPRFLIASWIAYLVSQRVDVAIYSFFKLKNPKNMIWIRAIVSLCFSAFLDNTIFSVTAFYFLEANPVSGEALWHTYILGTYALRVVFSFLSVPMIYLAKSFIPKNGD